MFDQLKWGLLVLLAILLLAAYGSLSLQLMPLENVFLALAPKTGLALLLIFAGKVALDITTPLLTRIAVSPELQPKAKHLWSLLVWLGIALAILSIFIGDINTLLIAAALIIGGFAFIVRKPILSFVGWFNITSNKLYSIGDLLEVEGLAGEVVTIDIFTTTLFDRKDGRHTTFPNSFTLDRSIANLTNGTNYAWDEIVIPVQGASIPELKAQLLHATDDVIGNKKMSENIKHYSSQLKHSALEPPATGPDVSVGMGESGPQLHLRYLVNARRREETKSALYEHILSPRARAKQR